MKINVSKNTIKITDTLGFYYMKNVFIVIGKMENKNKQFTTNMYS